MRPLALLSLVLLSACGPQWEPADPGTGSALEAFEAGDERMETFVLGGASTSPLADYLFVVDGSVSMNKVLGRFDRGVRSLSAEGVFPERARIAVMNTTPANPADLSQPHPVVGSKHHVRQSPGFLKLVDAEGLAAYAAAFPKMKQRMPEPGCAAWFGPGDTNANGVPCLVAHAQVDLQPVVAEAGLTAVKQWIERAEAPVFRPGANVNVIFISDTHDPGIPSQRANGKPARLDRIIGSQQLVESRPDFAELRALVEGTQPVASFRVHAIAPESECAERWHEFGPSYFDAARDAGGQTLDVCEARDYAPFLRATIRQGAVATAPVLAPGQRVRAITSVTVGDEPVAYTLDRGAIRLTDDLPADAVDVVITYRPER